MLVAASASPFSFSGWPLFPSHCGLLFGDLFTIYGLPFTLCG
jgi:hypothetical protein